jgi:hypothetical protein
LAPDPFLNVDRSAGRRMLTRMRSSRPLMALPESHESHAECSFAFW